MKELILVSYILLSICIAVYSVADGYSDYSVSIVDWYEDTDMNILGCILIVMLLILFNPIISIYKIITSFIYWVCHVGRK